MLEFEMMKPKCYGDNHELKPCEYIDTCTLCLDVTHCDGICKVYIVGLKQPGLTCKRDNPDFNGITKKQFFEAYKRLQKKNPVSITELLELAKIKGILIEE